MAEMTKAEAIAALKAQAAETPTFPTLEAAEAYAAEIQAGEIPT